MAFALGNVRDAVIGGPTRATLPRRNPHLFQGVPPCRYLGRVQNSWRSPEPIVVGVQPRAGGPRQQPARYVALHPANDNDLQSAQIVP